MHYRYVRLLTAVISYTFRDCVEHKAIMHHFVRGRMKNGIKDVAQRGYPIKDVEDVVPTRDDIYEYHAGMSYKKGITRPHRDVPFLRGASADAAILALKNECKYLVRVRARDMPSGQDWDNFAEVGALKSSAHVLVRALRRRIHCLLYKFMQVLWTFFVYYCHYEGLQMTHDMTRRVLMYVFYGHYTAVTKDSKKNSVSRVKPFHNWVHRKTSNGRSRYGPKVEKHFSKFITLFNTDDNKTSWTNLLTDGGEGKAPMEYLVTVEEGLRSFGSDGVHTMGTMPKESYLLEPS